jgi:1-acyl-sn-glycerol-3-phosphate acyltransferase
VLAWAARRISGVSVSWDDGVRFDRQCIYFANHTSHLDAVVVWAGLPGEVRPWVRPVAAKEYWERSRLRRYLASHVFRAVLVRRGTPESERSALAARNLIHEVVEVMGERGSLIIFPEGTRSDGVDVMPFKSGLYHLALRKPEAPLIPSYLENLNRILPKGELLPVPLLSSLRFGAPLHVEPGETKKAFLDRAHEALRSLKRS